MGAQVMALEPSWDLLLPPISAFRTLRFIHDSESQIDVMTHTVNNPVAEETEADSMT